MGKAKERRKARREERRAKGGGKVKQAVKQAGKKIKQAGKKVKEAAKKTVDKLKDVGGLAVLLPFKAAMKKLIMAKGLTPESDFDKLCQQFKTVVVDKKANFEESYAKLETLDPVTITVIISAITGFFKGLKKKKDSGEELSKFETEALDLAEQGTEAIEEEVEEQAKLSAFSPLIIVVVILILFFVFRK